MRMNELTENERDILDKLNAINLKYVKDETQSLWNVCWGYLNNKFNSSILQESDEVIRETLQLVNSLAPKVVSLDNSMRTPEEKKLYTAKKKDIATVIPVKHEAKMNALF